MAEALTKAQREWLEEIAREHRCVIDVYSGGASQCIQRLKNKGLIEYVGMEDWRDSFYRVTDAGRAALTSQGRPSEQSETAHPAGLDHPERK